MKPNTISTDKLIDAAEFFSDRIWANQGRRAIESIPKETAAAIIAYVLTLAVNECRAGLGLSDEIDLDYELPIFRAIDVVYDEYAGGCYFCDKSIDPNEMEFNRKTRLCPKCKLKMANFVQAIGIPPAKLLSGVSARKVQKTRIKIKKED